MCFSRLPSKSREFVFGYVEPRRGETNGWVLGEDAFSLDHSSCELPLLIDRNTYIHARDSEFEVGGALWDKCDLEVYIQSFGHAARAEGPENPSPPQSRRDREALECLEGWIFAKLALRHT